MTKTALILGGSGKIGTHSKRAFEARGWICRMYDRKAGNMAEAATGCDVIVNGLNPPNYHNWAEIIPAITEEVIGAAKASGATVIIPGNVYGYGDTGGVWSEATPARPMSSKGRIRVEMEARYAQSGVQVINLRAGNFIDPDKNKDVFSMLIAPKFAKGRIGVMGDTSAKQAYAYLPDWARAMVALAEMRGTLAQYEEVPFAGHAFSLDELKADMEAMTGRSFRYSHFPWWVMRVLSPFWELARELVEMRYLWNTPHELSGEKLARLLPAFEATPLRDVLGEFDINPDKTVTAGSKGKVVV